jgi:hypothetical protein
MPHPHQSVVWFELLHGLDGVVDEGEAGGFAATICGAQAEDVDLVLVGFVDGGELISEVVLGDIGAVGVEDVAGRILAQISHRVSLRGILMPSGGGCLT